MKGRFFGAVLSLLTIVVSLVGIHFVSGVVGIGGSGYAWEYIPGVAGVAIGFALLAYWIWGISKTTGQWRKKSMVIWGAFVLSVVVTFALALHHSALPQCSPSMRESVGDRIAQENDHHNGNYDPTDAEIRDLDMWIKSKDSASLDPEVRACYEYWINKYQDFYKDLNDVGKPIPYPSLEERQKFDPPR